MFFSRIYHIKAQVGQVLVEQRLLDQISTGGNAGKIIDHFGRCMSLPRRNKTVLIKFNNLSHIFIYIKMFLTCVFGEGEVLSERVSANQARAIHVAVYRICH